MADLIDRGVAKKYIRTALHADMDLLSAQFANAIGKVLDGVPTVDAVPVVRCNDCTHYNAGFECLIDGYGVERDPEWFCGDGERKDGDNHD